MVIWPHSKHNLSDLSKASVPWTGSEVCGDGPGGDLILHMQS